LKKNNSRCLTLNDIEEVPISSKEYETISELQNELFKMLAQQKSTDELLEKLCSMAEALLPNSVASSMLVDKRTGLMHVLSAPSVPQSGVDALNGLKPGLGGGSCGNAVFSNQATYVKDTFSDSRWVDLRQVAYDFNICSCWSMPIKDEKGKAIGTFALSSFEHRSPSSFHKKLLETCAYIISIILKYEAQDAILLKQNKRIELLGVAIEQAREGVMITDKNNHIIEINQAFTDILGYTKEDTLGKSPSLLSSGNRPENFYQNMWMEIKKHKNWNGEIVNRKKDGTLLTQWLSISAIYFSDNIVENYLAIFTDISNIKKAQQEIEYMLYHDTLTNLPNQKSLLVKVENLKTNTSLIVLNIDNFSYINDGYGFDVGNSILKKVSLLIKELAPEGFVYRLNADEFVILCESKDIAKALIIKIKSYFYKNSLIVDGITLNISFTYGASYGKSKEILRDAILALKEAKRFGKNRYLISSESVKISKEERNHFIYANNMIHKALEEDKFIPYFQGIYNNKSCEIEKYETLVRIDGIDKIISPIDFLETAKLSGLIPEITKIMIDKSFAFMKNNNFSFSLNITEDDLSMDYLVSYLTEKSYTYGIDPKRVILEILEGVSSSSKNSNISQLEALKSLGYNLAIDDFGTEYSNFERILDLDIDFLKIDGKYIKDIDTNKKSYEITKAIVYFAKNANIPVIAEFVHNKKIQKIIEELGIEYSQGYYFSEPNSIN